MQIDSLYFSNRKWSFVENIRYHKKQDAFFQISFYHSNHLYINIYAKTQKTHLIIMCFEKLTYLWYSVEKNDSILEI